MATDLPALLDAVTALLGRRDLTQQEYQAWHGGAADGGVNGNGLYPMTDSTGFVRMLPSPAKIAAIATSTNPGVIYPDQIDGAAGISSSHDDAAAIQGIWNAQLLPPYPRPAWRPRARYYSSAMITVDPSRNTLDGNNAQLGWDLKTFVDPTVVPELLKDAEFDTGTGWVAGTADGMPAGIVVYDGKLRVTQTAGVQKYFERGQQVLCAAGDSLTITILVDEVVPVTVGINTFRTLIMSLRRPASTPAISISGGANIGSSDFSIAEGSNTYAPGKTYTWVVTTSVANPYLRMSTNAGFTATVASVKITPNNTCLLVRVPPAAQGGNLRGHNQREFRNFKLSGRSGFARLTDMVMFDTPVYPTGDLGQHSRVNWYNFDISDNCGRGLVFKNRTYLSNFHDFRIVTGVANIDVMGGDDAGENINFWGGNLGGGDIAVRNLFGYATRFTGTSMDFCRQFAVGKGITMDRCWLENGATGGAGTFLGNMAAGASTITNVTADDFTEIGTGIEGNGIPAGTTVTGWNATLKMLSLSAATTLTEAVTGQTFTYTMTTLDRPLIDATGTIRCLNTLIQQDGTTNTRLRSPFRVAAGGLLEFDAHPAYNLPSREGALCTGEGRFVFTQRNPGPNRNVEPINKRDDNHNVVGSAGRFEAGTINLPVFFTPTASQQRPDPHLLTQYVNGSFTADMARGSPYLLNPSATPTAAVLNRQITSGQVSPGTTIADYQIVGTTFTGTTTVGSNVITGVTPAPTSSTARGKIVSAPGIPRGAKIISYTGTTLTLDQQASQAATVSIATPNVLILSQSVNLAPMDGAAFTYQLPNTDSAIIRLTDNPASFDGARCLEIYKDLPGNTATSFHVATPVMPNRGYGGEIRWAVPPNANLSGDADMYVTVFMRRVIDADGQNPRFATDFQQITDIPKLKIPMATGTNGWVDRSPYAAQTGLWRSLAFSLNTPGLGQHDGIVPGWATHWVWTFSMINMPRGSSVLIDGVIGNYQ